MHSQVAGSSLPTNSAGAEGMAATPAHSAPPPALKASDVHDAVARLHDELLAALAAGFDTITAVRQHSPAGRPATPAPPEARKAGEAPQRSGEAVESGSNAGSDAGMVIVERPPSPIALSGSSDEDKEGSSHGQGHRSPMTLSGDARPSASPAPPITRGGPSPASETSAGIAVALSQVGIVCSTVSYVTHVSDMRSVGGVA
jgi:hypothetical protein